MPTGYQIVEQDKLHFVTLQVVEWVDIFTPVGAKLKGCKRVRA